MDFDEIGHNLGGGWSSSDLSSLHNLDLKSDNSLTELNRSGGRVDEIVFWLTSGDLITLSVFLGLGTLSSDLTGDDNLATDSISASHDVTKDVVGSETDWGSAKELVFEGLNICSGAERSLEWKWFHRELKLVISIVEVVSLLDQRLDLLDLTGLLGDEVLSLGGAHADLSVDGGSADLNASVALHTESLLEELVQLSLEHTVGNELLLGVDLLNLSFGHRDYLLDCF